MKQVVVCCWALVALLSACSKNEQPKPAAPPPQLTITNRPVAPPPPAAIANDKIEQGFEVKNGGNLFLTFPRTWKTMITRIPQGDRMIDTILFRPRTNEEFNMLIGLNNVGEANAVAFDPQRALRLEGTNELTNSLEGSLDIQEVTGPQIAGCYFTVTDKTFSADHPALGQFPYLTQGYAKVGGLIISFRMTSNHLFPEQEQMLEMIKSVRFEKK